MNDGRRDWDAIVIGLGAIGSAAAYWLSRSLGDRVPRAVASGHERRPA